MAYTSLGPPAAPYGPVSAVPETSEIQVAYAPPARQNRLTVLVRALLVIPHLIALWALGVAAEIVLFIGWFAALFMGRMPDGLGEFLAGFLRWYTRLYSYLLLLTDQYPPFQLADADYPVRVEVRPGRLNRLAVFFRLILVIPAEVVAFLVLCGMGTIVAFISWLIVLITGRLPRPLHEAYSAGIRYVARFYGYFFLLTGRYPAGLFGDQPVPASAAGYAPPAGGDPSAVDDQPGGGGPWRLVLSGAAKNLIVVFLVIGVIAGVGYGFLISRVVGSTSSAAQSVSAQLSVNNAYNTLNTALTGFESKTSGCSGKVSCLTTVDTQMVTSFDTFARQLRAISMPSGKATSEAGQLIAVVSKTGAAFLTLSKATSASQYNSLVSSTGLVADLNQVQAGYNNLAGTLGMNMG